jgi:hypothetical protein
MGKGARIGYQGFPGPCWSGGSAIILARRTGVIAPSREGSRMPRRDSAEPVDSFSWMGRYTPPTSALIGRPRAEVVFTAGRPLVRRDVVHVQDLLNNIVNLSEHETANFFLPLGRREQNESRDHGANVDDNAAKFVRRTRLEFYGF